MNTANNSVVASVPVPGASGLAVTPDGSLVYVCALANNSVYAISTASNSIVATIGVGSRPVQLAISPNGARVFVVNQGSDQVSVIDTASNSVVATIGVGSRPTAVAVSPDGRWAFVGNLWSSSVSVIDTSTNTVAKTFAADSGPSAVAVSPNGQYVYVANEYAGNLTVHDSSSGNTVALVPGMSFPTSIALTPDGSKAYVANANSSSIAVIGTSSNSVIANIGVGAFPASVAISPDGGRAYVANEYNFSLSVIDTGTNGVVSTVAGIGIYPFAVAMAPPTRATPCSYSISPGSASYTSAGGAGTVNVSSTCNWSAASSAAWISISSGQSGSGNGTVAYSVAPNSSPNAIVGTLTIAGQVFAVSEAGIVCSYALSAASASLGSGGGNGSVNIVSPAGCGWSASSDSPWLTIGSGSYGSGSATVTFAAIANNSTVARIGRLAIGGQSLIVSQVGVSFAGIRVNCGGPGFTDAAGNAWAVDNQGNHSETIAPIANTSIPTMYQKDSWSTGTLQYQFAVPNGSFTVKLHFAEFYQTQRGQRVFNIVVNGITVFPGFDILAQTGLNTAIDESFPVTVNNGQVTIQLVPVTGTPKLSGLEVF